MGYNGGSGLCHVDNLIFLLTFFYRWGGGFVYVKKKWYLCIVIMIQFSYGRGTVCFVGCSKGTCFIKKYKDLFGPFGNFLYLCSDEFPYLYI